MGYRSLIASNLWVCPNCETENPLTLEKCEVCDFDMPLEFRPPKVRLFQSSAKVVNDVDIITLSWETEYANYVSLNGVRVSASGSKELPAREEYVLKAKNDVDTVEKSIKIDVRYPLEISSFNVESEEVKVENACNIQWEGRNVSSILLDDERYPVASPISFVPTRSGKHVISYVGKDGIIIKKEFNVSIVYPKPRIKLVAPDYAIPEKMVSIEWDTKYIDYVSIDDEVLPNKGHYQWQYARQGYGKTLVMHGLNGVTYKKEVEIREAQPAIIHSCTLSSNRIKKGTSCSVEWAGEHVVAWNVDGENMMEWNVRSRLIIPSKEVVVVSFWGEDGRVVRKELPIKIIPPILINKCEVTPSLVTMGDWCELSWSAENTDCVTIKGKDYVNKGSCMLRPEKSEHVDVVFHGEDGSTIARKVFVQVMVPPVEVCEFKVSSNRVKAGSVVTILWKSENVKSVSISGISPMLSGLPANASYDFTINADASLGFTFYGLDGKTVFRTVNISVIAAPKIRSCSANQYKVKEGESCTIRWASDNVSHVEIRGKHYYANDSLTINPQDDETLQVVFYGEDGSQHHRTIKIEVEKSYSGVWAILIAMIVAFIVTMFVVKSGGSGTTAPPPSPPTQAIKDGKYASEQSKIDEKKKELDRYVNVADVDTIGALVSAKHTLMELEKMSGKKCRLEKNKIKEKAQCIKDTIATSPVSDLPVNKNKIERLDSIIEQLK